MIWTCHQVSGRPLLNLQNLCAGSPLSSASVVVLNSSEYEAALRPTSVLSKSLPSPGVTLSCSGRLPFVARVASSATLASHGHLLPLVKSQYAVRSSWRMSIGEVKPVASTPFHLATKPSQEIRKGNCAKLAHVVRGIMQPETQAETSPDLVNDGGLPSSVADDTLLVVGPGVLGRLIAQRWLQEFEGSEVIGQTKTTNNHDALKSLGIVPALKDEQATKKYSYVVFCAPPYGNDDYIGEIRDAAQRWNGKGSLLFTSSSAVYDVNDNGPCDEGVAPVVTKGASPRTDRLLSAEEEVLKVGGNVVRLAGLYTEDRGAHAYWWKLGTVDARPDHILNLIHYEDAASLSVAILKAKTRAQTFVGCDGTPVSRQEIMELTAKSGRFDGEFKGFSGTSGVLGKKMSNTPTREALGWNPKYGSFAQFLDSLK